MKRKFQVTRCLHWVTLYSGNRSNGTRGVSENPGGGELGLDRIRGAERDGGGDGDGGGGGGGGVRSGAVLRGGTGDRGKEGKLTRVTGSKDSCDSCLVMPGKEGERNWRRGRR